VTEFYTYTIPNSNIQTLTPIENLDFFDKQSIQISKTITPLDAWRAITNHPAPILKLAFRIRDMISSWFGVKKIEGFSGDIPKTVKADQMLDFFLVEYISQNTLTLTSRDKHLDVMTCISTCQNILTITSSVKTHSTFGRLYMIPVRPIHKLLVRNNLKQLQKEFT